MHSLNRESNSGPLVYKTSALPLSYKGMMRPVGDLNPDDSHPFYMKGLCQDNFQVATRPSLHGGLNSGPRAY